MKSIYQPFQSDDLSVVVTFFDVSKKFMYLSVAPTEEALMRRLQELYPGGVDLSWEEKPRNVYARLHLFSDGQCKEMSGYAPVDRPHAHHIALCRAARYVQAYDELAPVREINIERRDEWKTLPLLRVGMVEYDERGHLRNITVRHRHSIVWSLDGTAKGSKPSPTQAVKKTAVAKPDEKEKALLAELQNVKTRADLIELRHRYGDTYNSPNVWPTITAFINEINQSK